MAYVHARKKPGRYGTDIAFVTALVSGTATLTANTTTIFRIPSPFRKARFLRGNVSVTTVPADSDGAITGVFKKYDASADDVVTLSADVDLEALVTREVTKADSAAAATEAQLVLDDGDCLEFHVANDSAAINTQPTNLALCVELAVLE